MPRSGAGRPNNTSAGSGDGGSVPPVPTFSEHPNGSGSAPRSGTPFPVVDGERFLADLDQIAPNPRNVREDWEWEDDPEFDTFVENVKQVGMLQDPTVIARQVFAKDFPADDATLPEGALWVLATGERRYRAALRLGDTKIPVVLRNGQVAKMDETIWSENQSRKGLNPLQEGILFSRFAAQGLDYEQIAQRLGSLDTKLSPTTISKKVRLLDLPEGPVRHAVASRSLGTEPAYLLLTRLKTPELIEVGYQRMLDTGAKAKDVVEELAPSTKTKVASISSAKPDAPSAATVTPDQAGSSLAAPVSSAKSDALAAATVPPQEAGSPVASAVSSTKPPAPSTAPIPSQDTGHGLGESPAATNPEADSSSHGDIAEREACCEHVLEKRGYQEPDQVLERLAVAVISMATTEALTLAASFLREDWPISPNAMPTGSLLPRAADAVALASSELRLRNSPASAWDTADADYLNQLVNGADYEPTHDEAAHISVSSTKL